jgi:hypothetical protein
VTIPTGTLIHGTLRPQDLLPAFRDFLKEHNPGYRMSFRDEAFILDLAEAEDANTILDEAHPVSGVDGWETAGYVMDMLVERLDSIAPEGYYFGAHEGDGADFGYWLLPGHATCETCDTPVEVDDPSAQYFEQDGEIYCASHNPS